MAADGMVMSGARASVAVVLTFDKIWVLFQNKCGKIPIINTMKYKTITRPSHLYFVNSCQVKLLPSEVAQKPRLGSGGRLNKKDGLTRYGDSHVKDKTS